MQNLINQISTEFELTQDDATKIVNLVQNYEPSANADNNTDANKEDESNHGEQVTAQHENVTEEKGEQEENDEQEENVTAEKKDEPALNKNELHATAAPVAAEEEGIFAKATHFVEDHLPGGIKEKAEEMIGGLGSKVAGFFK